MTDEHEERPYVKVSDVMVQQVRTIDRLATITQAVEEMRKLGVSSLAVERRDHSDEYGLLTMTDIAREILAKSRIADRVNVYEVMSKPVITLPEDMSIRYGVRMLVKFGISRAMVVDEHRVPVGIVTLRDMVLRSIGG